MTELRIPELCLVLLVGASGAGKSTFAAAHFGPTETLSSDTFRGLVSDDPTSQDATADAFDALHHLAAIRLRRGRLTVIDATNTQRAARAGLLALAKEHDVPAVAVVLDLPESVCAARSRFGARVVGRQHDELRRSLGKLRGEGFRTVHRLSGPDEVDQARIVRTRSYNDLRELAGPFDLIGDVHGCLGELCELLTRLGWTLVRDEAGAALSAQHPHGRTAVLLGDLVDRGPDVPGVLRLVMGMVRDGTALAIAGNHEIKLVRALRGRDVSRSHGLVESLTQIEAAEEAGPGFTSAVTEFMDGMVAHYVLDQGRLVVAHAGLREQFHGRASGRVRQFALWGETTGETDEFGLPVRYPWATEYRGDAVVAYGHTPVLTAEWVNNTICLDTGCVFGGGLSALRYPEREIVSVPAERTWYEPIRPLAPPAGAPAPERDPERLEVTDVLGKHGVLTALHGRVTVPAENSAAALEVLSRYAVHPRWLVYLPPTMAPVDELPEHPSQAFDHFAAAGVERVVLQAKHMGSRAVVLIARSAEAAARVFGATGGQTGIVLSRTGRRLLADPEPLLAGLRAAADSSGLWDELRTDWLVLDGELLPWALPLGRSGSSLVSQQYEPVAAAALADSRAVAEVLAASAARSAPLTAELAEQAALARSRVRDAEEFDTAWRHYAGAAQPVRLAPFCVLAGAGEVYAPRPVDWQLAVLDRLVAAGPEHLVRTERCPVTLADAASRERGVRWWQELVDRGGEGAVVKPADGCARGPKGLVQPGLKVRGPDYLRLVYGPHYQEPANLDRLRRRNLGRKRSLALREYALGLEALHRFVTGDPLWRVHQAVAAVLALESEPVDPRL